jgi:hypothetical protein
MWVENLKVGNTLSRSMVCWFVFIFFFAYDDSLHGLACVSGWHLDVWPFAALHVIVCMCCIHAWNCVFICAASGLDHIVYSAPGLHGDSCKRCECVWDRSREITRGNYSVLRLRRVVRLLSAKCDSKQVFAERERKKNRQVNREDSLSCRVSSYRPCMIWKCSLSVAWPREP